MPLATLAPRQLAALALLGLASCATPTRGQALQEAAFEMNTNTRYGRADTAISRVADASRERFLKLHKRWHTDLRIVDVDLAGLTFRPDGDADVFVSYSWQPVTISELRSSVIHQVWHSERGNWLLVSEDLGQGDPGLLGEPPAESSAAAASTGERQFRTTVIR
jgi:hypothetical protein